METMGTMGTKRFRVRIFSSEHGTYDDVKETIERLICE